jgi:hypothetical protein
VRFSSGFAEILRQFTEIYRKSFRPFSQCAVEEPKSNCVVHQYSCTTYIVPYEGVEYFVWNELAKGGLHVSIVFADFNTADKGTHVDCTLLKGEGVL